LKAIKKILLILLILGLLLSTINLILYFNLPNALNPYFQKKSLLDLKENAQKITKKWKNLLNKTVRLKEKINNINLESEREIFDFLKKLNIDKKYEGISFINSRKEMVFWSGKVGILESEIFNLPESCFIIKKNAKSFLVFIFKIKEGYLAFFRILSFYPQIKILHLRKYNFFEEIENLHIQFFSYKEKNKELDKFFRERKDVYLSKQFHAGEKWSLSFPLRGPNKNLLAVVTLNSLPLEFYYLQLKNKLLFLLFLILIFLLTCLLLLLIFSYKKSFGLKGFFLITGIILNLTIIRITLFIISNFHQINKFIQKENFLLKFFSSNMDVLFTSLYLSAIFYLALHFLKNKLNLKSYLTNSLLNSILFSLPSVFFLLFFNQFVKTTIKISDLNLENFSLSFTHLISYFSFIILIIIISYSIILMSELISSKIHIAIHIILVIFLLLIIYITKVLSFPLLTYSIFYILIIYSYTIQKFEKKKASIIGLTILTLVVYLSIHFHTTEKKQKIVSNILLPRIISVEKKAEFILKQSIIDMEKEKKLIIEYFKNPYKQNFSFYLWKNSPLSKCNWNSAIEIWNKDGKEISKFSFNMPFYYLSEYILPISTNWIITTQEMHFLGKKKKLLIGYKDWFESKIYLGKLLIYLSIDYDMLPFPFVKNPYSELLKAFSYPIEHKIFNLAIFNSQGFFIFNPGKLSTGISPFLLNTIINSPKPIWKTIKERNKEYSALYFKHKKRIYSIFFPNKSFRKHVVDYIKLFLIYFIFFNFLIFLYLLITKKIENPLQSFSRKVYLFFFIIAIFPLLFFSLFTQKFFSRQFSEQFREKAEAHLSIAQSVMEDFAALQKGKKKINEIFPNDLVLWISSTINNDVNLYRRGKLISSSKKELFELGLLPQVINGETFYKIYWENKPYDIRKEEIGDLTFYTLTIPTIFSNQIFLLSLPFPSGKEEISLASQELIEFLIFSSIFIIGIAFLLAQSMGRIILNPIKKLLTATREVSNGNLEVKIEHYSKDEIQTLIKGFNNMIENLKRQQKEIVEMSKKVAWTEMARRIAHEIKNPLTPILLSAEQILKVYEDKSSLLDKTIKESAEYIIKEAEHLRKIAQEFLLFSKEEKLKKENFNLNEIIQEEITPYKKTFHKKIKFIEIFPKEKIYIFADREKLKISFRNILINSIEAIHKKGEIKIKLWKDKDWINIEISDTGEGIKKEFLEKIFEPYFSTKEGGTGLGLSIAKKIIEQHDGEISIFSEIGKGTTTLIRLPSLI